jgi:hypothetical protein
MASFTPPPRYLGERRPSTHWIEGYAPEPVWTLWSREEHLAGNPLKINRRLGGTYQRTTRSYIPEDLTFQKCSNFY